jgi:hypothetical protein
VTLKCEVSNPAMTCKLPTPKIVIGPDGSNTLVNLYATGTRARRLQQARGVDSSYTVRVTASANGESKTVLESF